MVKKYGLLTFFVGTLLIITATSQSLWDYKKIDWAYWLANLAFSFSLLLPGMITLFAPNTFVLWMQSFKRNRHNKKIEWKQLDIKEKTSIYVITVIYTGIGLVILLTTLYRLLNACSPMGDCPGLGIGL